MKWSGRGKAFQVVNSKEKGESLPNVGGCVQQEGRHAQDQKRKQPEATWEDRTSPPASRSLARALRHMALPLRHTAVPRKMALRLGEASSPSLCL